VPLVSISAAQRRPVPDANWLATIYHGIELDEFTFNPQMGGYLAFSDASRPIRIWTARSERHVALACRY
jgi:hypothetical protein